MTSPFREEAVPLVTLENDKFRVNPDALEILKAIDSPIIVVGVAGLYRTGKSYLLNRIILNRERGFGVASTINACTKGIWMWGKPLKAQTENNEIVNLIIIDSEGLGALDQDSSHDCRIFALVLLLSSVFIYNSTGALDESAINNLSLVINLTKHIRVKASNDTLKMNLGHDQDQSLLSEQTGITPGKELNGLNFTADDEDDSEEFSNYFPAFLWVLRDFSLQLVDEDGDPITSKQYLENALQQRGGISDEIEHKNRIRRLIQNFFRERDCYTLVRPLTDEENLKRLDEIEMEKLRPEFIYQALELRKKITTLNKKKSLRGKDINGEILGSLLVSYTTAINGGAVPNIENAWFYICQRQTRTLIENCIMEFADNAKEKIESNMPISSKTLRTLVKDLKSQALARFTKESMLSESEKASYLNEISTRIKEMTGSLKADNDHEFESLLMNSLNTTYSDNVYPKVVDDKVADAKDVVNMLQDIRKTFEKIEPEGPKKSERIFKFLFARSCEAHTILWKNKQTKVAQQLSEKERECVGNIKAMEEQLKTVKEQKQTISSRVEALQKQLHETDFEKSKLEQVLLSTKEELVTLEQETTKRRTEEKTFYKNKQDELIKKLEEAEKAHRAVESNFAKQKSEFETELALLNQKIEFYQKLETDLRDQITRLQNRLKRFEDENSEKYTKTIQDYEQKMKAQADEIAKLKEHKQNYEVQLGLKINAHESLFKDFEEKEDELRSFINIHEKTILSLREQLKTKDAQTTEKTEREQQLSEQVTLLEEEVKSLEQKLKARDDKIQLLTMSLDKEQVLSKQKIDFYEIKLNDFTSEIEELKKVKENAFQALQNTTGVKSDLSKQLQELRNGFEERIKKMTEEFESERDDLLARMNHQAEEDEQKIKDLKKEKETLVNEKLELKSNLSNVNETIQRLQERINLFEQNRTDVMKETETFYEEKIRKLEQEMEEAVEAKDQELKEAQNLLEETVRNMQLTFEAEKNRLEKRLSEEKAKFDSFIKGNLEELEKKRVEEVQALEEEIENLQLELQSQDLKYRTMIQKLENEVSTAKSKQETAERRLNELKVNLEKDLLNEKNKAVYLAQSLENERKGLFEKIDAQKSELAAKSLEIFQLKQTAETSSAAYARQISEHEKTIADLLNEATEFKSRVDALVQEKYALNDELVVAKTQLSKEAALHAQKIEYMEKRIADLNKALDTYQNDFDEKIKFIKQEHDSELNKVKNSLHEEIHLWESRYEEKKKASKEIEGGLSQKISELEKSKYILQEKLSQAELRRDELEKKLQLETSRSDTDMKRLKENYLLERKNLFGDLENLRKEKYELEIALAEATAKFDKDRAVLEGKISFLEQQNKKLKSDLSESQTNFDVMFQKFHQFRVADKEETEQTHSSYVLAIEQRYNAQILDLKEQNKTLIDTYKEKLRNLEREIRRLEQTNQELTATRQGSGQLQERKINELLENEKKLQDEILKLKSDLDKATFNAQKEFEKEREVLKKKIYESDARYKKLETEKHLMVLEQEKQKTKWHIEKDQLLSQKSDTLELLDRLQKQKDTLTRDNEKLKNDLKAQKKANLANNLLSMTKMNNRSDLFSVDKSILSPHEYLGSNHKTGNSSPRE